jgi:hypothetical protein
LHFRTRASLSVPGRPSAPGRWTIHVEPGSRLFVVFVTSSYVALFRSVELGVFGWRRFAGLSARGRWTVCTGQTVCGLATDCQFFVVQSCCSGRIFEPSAVTLRTVRLALADGPPGHLEPSTPGTTNCLSPLLLELHFRVALSLSLFLGLVGLL